MSYCKDKSEDIFIGVDGGASNCRVRLENAAGKLLGQGRAGPASIRISVAATWRSILEACAKACVEASIVVDFCAAASSKNAGYTFYLGCGLAGCELPLACRDFIAAKPDIFRSLRLESDAYTACLGAHGGQDGAIISVGTGVTSLQIQGEKITKVGGFGFPHGDEGGAAWFGLEAVRMMLQWLDGRHEIESVFLHELFAQFNSDITNVIAWANSQEATPTAFAKLAPLVFESAERGDANAAVLMRRAAREIERIAAVFVKNTLGDELLPCCLCGGLAPFIESYVADDLRARLVARKGDGATGALLMLRKKLATS